MPQPVLEILALATATSKLLRGLMVLQIIGCIQLKEHNGTDLTIEDLKLTRLMGVSAFLILKVLLQEI
jgi:hypothetical protein